MHEIPAHDRLADAVPIADLVTVSRKRAIRKDAKTDGGRPVDSAVHGPNAFSP